MLPDAVEPSGMAAETTDEEAEGVVAVAGSVASAGKGGMAAGTTDEEAEGAVAVAGSVAPACESVTCLRMARTRRRCSSKSPTMPWAALVVWRIILTKLWGSFSTRLLNLHRTPHLQLSLS